MAGELEVRRLWEAAGLTVRGLEGEGDHAVYLPGGAMLHSEVKRQERLQLPMWLRQAEAEAPPGTVPVVAFRQNRGAWYVALELDRLAALLAS